MDVSGQQMPDRRESRYHRPPRYPDNEVDVSSLIVLVPVGWPQLTSGAVGALLRLLTTVAA